MSRRAYSAEDTVTIAAAGTPDTCIAVIGSAILMLEIYDILFGMTSTPADQQCEWEVRHFTADGTGDDVTPRQLDANIIDATATAKGNYGTEPTYAGIALVRLGLHQRSSFRWVARPGSELITKSAAGDGIGSAVDVTSGTPTGACTILFSE